MANQVVSGQNNTPVLQRQEISTLQRTTLATPQEDEKLSTAESRMEKDKLIQEKPEVQLEKKPEEEPIQKMTEPKEEEEPVQKKEEPKEEEPLQKKEGPKEEEEPLQKKDAPEEEKEPLQMAKEEEEPLQKKTETASNSTASTQLSSRIKEASGKGTPLPDQTRTEMEGAIGADFSGVNIHTDTDAVQMNRELGAQAFTHGQDVYFNSGKYNPEASSGKHLLAHELTHVVQQGKSQKVQKVQLQAAPTASLTAARFQNNPKLEAAFQNKLHIKKNAKGDHVRILQKALLDDGIALPKFGVDGEFGEETQKAIIAYQTKYKLSPDGIVGPVTLEHLDKNFATVVLTERYDKWYQEQTKLFKAEKNFPYHVAVMNVFYKSRNFHVIQMLNDVKYDVYTFSGAIDYWKHKDGKIEEVDLSASLRGNTEKGGKFIRLNEKLKPLEAAMTLYHELNHVFSKEPDYLKQEIESRVVSEQFAIDNNLPPTKKEYRTKDGKVDKAFIENEIRNSQHYNPKDKTRIGRTYKGETKIGPWIVPI
ncbi:DUF4157 domain-containing protein [Haliscomenobacter sp.]|uniref:eCIS core domain-containing protein n=1 Tax=Haliscomenobacter sp. TaxID=2717303 RepID=UPI00336507BC